MDFDDFLEGLSTFLVAVVVVIVPAPVLGLFFGIVLKG